MSYKIHYKDVVIECNTVEEALQFTSHLKSVKVEAVQKEHSENNLERSAVGGSSRWTEKRLKEFLNLAKNSQQYKVIESLLDSPDGRTLPQLLSLLGATNGRILAGVFSGMAKNAKKVGVDYKDLYICNRVSIGGEMQKEYKLTDSFRSAVERYGKE